MKGMLVVDTPEDYQLVQERAELSGRRPRRAS